MTAARIPIPDEFASIAADMKNHDLMERYGVSQDTITRWRTLTGTRSRLNPHRRALPDDFPAMAGRLTLTGLISHYHCSQDVIRRWSQESGCKPLKAPTGRPRNAAHYGSHKNYVLDSRDSSLASRAQSWLQRFYPVWRCDAVGRFDPKGSHYRCDGTVRTVEDMIARAERKGFSADEWQRVAA